MGMDISKFTYNEKNIIAGMYIFAAERIKFNVEDEFCGKPKKLAKFLRKELSAEFDILSDFSEESKMIIENAKSDDEIIELFGKCYISARQDENIRHEKLRDISNDFSKSEKEVFLQLFDYETCTADRIEYKDKTLKITIEDSSVVKKAVFFGVSGFQIDKNDTFNFYNADIEKNADGYSVFCPVGTFDDDDTDEIIEKSLNFSFKTFETEINIFKISGLNYFQSPLEVLFNCAYDIIAKYDFDNDFLNEKETALLPILNEINLLRTATTQTAFLTYPPMEEKRETEYKFPLLKQKSEFFGLKHIEKLLKKIENAKCEKQYRAALKLGQKFNSAECEPMWRNIYNAVIESQLEYPTKKLPISKDRYDEIVTEIEDRLHSLGYSGNYPEFFKNGSIKGIKLEKSYDNNYFIGFEKNTEYRIFCTEHSYEEDCSFEFICGTALLKKNESVSDIFSCCFNAKGRRIFKNVVYNEPTSQSDDDFYEVFGTLEEAINISVKKAECKRLNKRERKVYYGQFMNSAWDMIIPNLFAGAFFSLFMMMAMILICIIACAVANLLDDVRELLQTVPWKFLFWFAFLAFAGLKTLSDFLVERK